MTARRAPNGSLDAELRPVLVVVRDTGPEAEDGLVLGSRLAKLQAVPLVIVPVVSVTRPFGSPERARRLQIAQTRIWARDRLPHDCAHHVLPVAGPSPQQEIHALARECDAELLVLPSQEHSPSGRVHLGHWEASTVVHNAPCAVAVAPLGYHARAAGGRLVVGVAFDGLPESLAPLRSAHALACAAAGALRVIVVGPGEDDAEFAGPVAALGTDVEIEFVELQGDPVARLTEASTDLGLLVCGSRDRRPLRRLALGRIPLALMRSAACPLLVVAPGTPIPATRRLSA